MTPRIVSASALAAALALSACKGRRSGDAPWLTMPTPDEHAARFFPANAGTPHASAQCNDCHGGFDSFKQFDCIHCHTGDHADAATVTGWHGGVTDFAFTSDACYRCHPAGRGSFPNHGPFFPIDAGTSHATVACSSCHLDPANRLTLGCAGCHPHEQATVDPQHAQVNGYAFDSALCVRCHADAQVTAVASHQPFRIAPGSGSHAEPGAGGACLTCHPAMRADKAWATDFDVVTCVVCHDQAAVTQDHTGVQNFAYTTAACVSCHPTGSAGN